jgi:hypothetical protein
MRDPNTIDAKLMLVAALRRADQERAGPLPSIAPTDDLLDERLSHRGRPRAPTAGMKPIIYFTCGETNTTPGRSC